jgi:acyl carrier protein
MDSTFKTTIASRIEEYIRNQYRVSSSDTYFSTEVNLWEEGYLDSLGVVEVISFVETTFEVTIPEIALFSEDFTNINGMAGIVADLVAVR